MSLNFSMSCLSMAAILVAADMPAVAQQDQSRAPVRSVATTDLPARAAISLVPVPSDAYELGANGVKAASSPAERAAALSLFERAIQTAKLHMPGTPPYQLNVSFASAGNSAYVGSGELTETWFSGVNWRWTAKLGAFSVVRVPYRGQALEDKKVESVPSRIQMLRNAIFWAVQGAPSNAQLRTASAIWNGRPVTCVLVSGVSGSAAASPGRLWEEEEYCIDNATGTIQILSVAPGVYTVYSYGRKQQFHDTPVPDKITITMAGSVVVDAQVSLTDANPADMNQLTPTPQMLANGPGITLSGPMRSGMNRRGASVSAVQSVIVHAQITADGQVEEVELAAASDPALGQSALDWVRQATFPPLGTVQRQSYINVRFIP